MNTIFINSENSKTSDLHRLLLNLTDKIDLRRKDKYIALSNLSIYHTLRNIKKSYENNTFKISARTQNEEFELPDGSYSVSNIQDSFEFIFKSMGKKQFIRILYLAALKGRQQKIKMVKMFLIQKLQKQYQYIVMLFIIVINKIQGSCLHLFLINLSVNNQIFHLKILYFQKFLIQNFPILMHGLQIKILILQKQRRK